MIYPKVRLKSCGTRRKVNDIKCADEINIDITAVCQYYYYVYRVITIDC